MEILTKKSLINLPVFTRSGQPLGKVVDFELEPGSQVIMRYRVESRDLIKELLSDDLLISREQVLSLSAEKMVVDDAVVQSEDKKIAAATIAPAS